MNDKSYSRLFADRWDEYRESKIGADVSGETLETAKSIFYAGALGFLTTVGVCSKQTNEQQILDLMELRKEVHDYFRGYCDECRHDL